MARWAKILPYKNFAFPVNVERSMFFRAILRRGGLAKNEKTPMAASTSRFSQKRVRKGHALSSKAKGLRGKS
ncbi:MAG TPA: hypothetical protein VE986_07230 [Hyphomicrobiales bacterium]|nr:hypothetical protein [Hyphomicrobiales bacterium]